MESFSVCSVNLHCGEDNVVDEDVDGGVDDDIYIMVKCMSVCMLRKGTIPYSKDLVVSHVYSYIPYSKELVISMFLDTFVVKRFCETQPPASIGRVPLSSVVRSFVRPA